MSTRNIKTNGAEVEFTQISDSIEQTARTLCAALARESRLSAASAAAVSKYVNELVDLESIVIS